MLFSGEKLCVMSICSLGIFCKPQENKPDLFSLKQSGDVTRDVFLK